MCQSELDLTKKKNIGIYISNIPIMNVLAISNFRMEFIYTYVGTPERAHDSKILTYCANNDDFFQTPPEGKYFFADSGYINWSEYLASYPRTRYHPHQWRGEQPTNENEMFNKRHSSLWLSELSGCGKESLLLSEIQRTIIFKHNVILSLR